MDKTAQQQLPIPLQRFNEALKIAGMDEEARGFLVGRMVKVVTVQVMNELGQLLGGEGIKKIKALKTPEEQQKELEKVFLEKKGKSLTEYRNEITEKLVKEFEEKGQEEAPKSIE